jgi:ABC-type nitrate/sulfonate/bicarbonate transport system substrate-binding protein
MTTSPRLGAALAVAALLLAGCGGSDGDSASADGGSSSGPTTLRIAETAGAPLNFLTYGDQQGFFEDAGLKLEITSSTGGATVIPQLVSGELDAAGSNVVSALIAASKGLPLQMVAAGTSTSEDEQQDFSALVVKPDSPATSIADLAGKKIAVNSLKNINDIVLGSMLEKAGLSYDDVQFVELPFPDMAGAVENGSVDAAMVIEPFITMAEGQGLKVIGRPYWELKPGLQIGTYLMSKEFVAKHPDTVEAFQKGVQATADAIAEDPDSFRAALPKISQTSPEVAQKVRINLWRGKDDKESLTLIQGLMVDYQLIDKKVDLDEVVVN